MGNVNAKFAYRHTNIFTACQHSKNAIANKFSVVVTDLSLSLADLSSLMGNF